MMKIRFLAVWLALLLLAAGCGALEEMDAPPVAVERVDEGPADRSVGGVLAAEDECPFAEPAGFQVSCGWLTVPEKHDRPAGPFIDLAYAIVHAADDQGRPPLIYLAGGPGGSAIDDFLGDPEGWDYPFTRQRDLILLDQRGTGYSQPSLDCPELEEEVAFEDENPERACQRRLANEGIDLSAYNTVENAADVEALRQALGLAQWDLLGVSYGTRLALTVMRDYPQGVRSAVLDSVFPPNADTPVDEALAPWWSLQRLFSDCAAEAYCRDVYPDLEAAFLDTVAALNERPEDGLFGDDFAFVVTNALNDSELIPLVPYVIDAVANGDIGALDEIDNGAGAFGPGRTQDEPDRSDSEGMYNSVICHEEYVFGDYEAVEAQVVGAVPAELEAALLQPVADLFQVCAFWGAGAASPGENEAVASPVPTLLLVGQYDHATPPEWAALAAETLPNSFLYEFPGTGHSVLSGPACAVAITAAFLDAPARRPEADCIAAIEWPYFE
ncbi:MAG: alpha/beta fold hydrolase [Candidatus Promineifilaceae bacterium]|nr:alpha/beta fold hydrolase [Candidatus Promineifilaceae bacterium]